MKRTSHLLAALFCGVCAIFLILDGKQVANGVVSGIRLCLETVIPALFCFMVLTGFLLQSGLYRLLSIPLAPISKHLLFLPPSLGSVVVLSLIGGFPMGAKSIAELLDQNRIDHDTAQRMLLYCFCAGPSFIITAVGAGMFGNAKLGVLLYLIQLFLSLIFAVILGLFARFSPRQNVLADLSPAQCPAPFLPMSQAFVVSVGQAVSSLAQMCGFIILFRAVSEILSGVLQSGVFSCAILGTLEVTNGCMLASQLPSGAVYASCFLSFGGLSVIAQAAGILKDSKLSFKPFLLVRCLHAVCSGSITFFYLKAFPHTMEVFSSTAHPIPVSNPNTPILSICLLMMSGLFMLELSSVCRRL